jgi:Cu+-exporting ATPase
LSGWLEKGDDAGLGDFSEVAGMGMNAKVGNNRISIGSPRFIRGIAQPGEEQTRVLVSWNNRVMGSFAFSNHYRQDMARLISQLKNSYQLSVVSGDGEGEKSRLANMFGGDAILLFRQNPESKKEYVKKLQRAGDKVAMIGDGLNDGIALQQSNVGIALADDSNNFTPASDAILEAGQLLKLPAFLTLCKANRKVIMASFMLSIAYNLAGLYFAVQGTLSPLLAAILMPLSSMTILIVTYGATSWTARTLKL